MVFSSLTFLFLYLPIVMLLMKTLPLKYRNLCLFLVSLVFYGWGEPKYVVIMLISTVADYFNGAMVHKYRDEPAKAKRFVWLSVVFNLSVLGFFKYYDFFVINLNNIGFNLLHPLGLSLPVGISFYTFQTMSYPIDVYRKEAEVQENVVDFGAYVTMFPQLIAGPIVRYRDIDAQLKKREETMDKFYVGIQRFMVGLAKKVLLANNTGYVWEQISALSASSMSVATAWLGIIMYAFQIYFDFSGYSDMAIGLGKMLGFDFLENFNYPYLATSVSDFWRRWHISLSSWFRDYVYIPLGGNRCSKLRNLFNIMVVWMLTGFWHGASWNFLLWGCFYGIVLIIERLFLGKLLKKSPKFVQHVYTLFMVNMGWVLFALIDKASIMNYFSMLFGIGTKVLFDGLTIFYLRDNLVLIIAAVLACGPWGKQLYHRYFEGNSREIIMQFLMVACFVICIAFIVDATYNPFLYFRF